MKNLCQIHTLIQGLTEIVNCESVYGERASKHAREVLSAAGIKPERKHFLIFAPPEVFINSCEKCEAEKNSGYRHACPLQQEIHGEYDPEFCCCCEDCTRNCRMEI